jgi:hypothetical protein
LAFNFSFAFNRLSWLAGLSVLHSAGETNNQRKKNVQNFPSLGISMGKETETSIALAMHNSSRSPANEREREPIACGRGCEREWCMQRAQNARRNKKKGSDGCVRLSSLLACFSPPAARSPV